MSKVVTLASPIDADTSRELQATAQLVARAGVAITQSHVCSFFIQIGYIIGLELIYKLITVVINTRYCYTVAARGDIKWGNMLPVVFSVAHGQRLFSTGKWNETES